MSDEQRTARLGIRLEPSELELIKKSAAMANMGISEYVRKSCLRKKDSPTIIVDGQELRALYRQVRAAGNNLNQIAHDLNTHHDSSRVDGLMTRTFTELENACEEVSRFIASVRSSV